MGQHHLASLDQPEQVLEDFVLWLFGSLLQVGEGERLLAVEDVGLEVVAEERLRGLEGGAGYGSIVCWVGEICVFWHEGVLLSHSLLGCCCSCLFLDQSLQFGKVAGAEDALLEFLSILLQPHLELQVLGMVVQLPMSVLDGLVGDIELVEPHSGGCFVQVDLLIELFRLPPGGPVCG